MSIENIYNNKKMLFCDCCEDGEELDSFEDCLEFIDSNDWITVKEDNTWYHFCSSCKG